MFPQNNQIELGLKNREAEKGYQRSKHIAHVIKAKRQGTEKT